MMPTAIMEMIVFEILSGSTKRASEEAALEKQGRVRNKISGALRGRNRRKYEESKYTSAINNINNQLLPMDFCIFGCTI
jgi:hypothetical protein